MQEKPAILFVCLGNICRSPLAEAALRHEAATHGADLIVDSAGTGDWNVGDPPDPRALAEARRHGIDMSEYRARQVERDDFHRYDHIIAFDEQNLADLIALAPPDGRASVSLLLDHVEGMEGQAVADPYFGEDEGFSLTWRQVSLAARALVEKFARVA